jgi:hypothetical protein
VVIAATAIAPAVAVEPITEKPWREAVLSVTDLDVTARFFTEIGGYETLDRGALSASAIAAWGLPPQRAEIIDYSARRWAVTLGRFGW